MKSSIACKKRIDAHKVKLYMQERVIVVISCLKG